MSTSRIHQPTPPRRFSLQLRAAVAVCAVGLVVSASAAEHIGSSLVGTWRLVSYVDTPDGAAPIFAFGAEPRGLFIFTMDGHVSISIMRNPPDTNVATTDPDPEACIPGWYCSYFGTYTVDEKKGVWVTRVLGANIPAYLVRIYRGRSASTAIDW